MKNIGTLSHKIFLIRAIFALFIAATAAFGVVHAANAQDMARDITLGDGEVDRMVMAPGHVLTIRTDTPIVDLVVGNTDVADVYPLTSTSIYIQAKQSGFTNVALYGEAKQLLGVIDVRVQYDFSELQGVIGSAVPGARVNVANVNNRIRLTGEVSDNVAMERVLEIARQYTDEPVINAVRIRGGQQVQLEVRILEVARTAGRDLGIQLGIDAGPISFNGGSGGAALTQILQWSGPSIELVINALEEKGLARRLANPNLITTSGVEANFVVGGEVPIRNVVYDDKGNPQQQTDYREYGVVLNFLPNVLDDGLIRLRIRPEVSRPDETFAFTEGTGFISRKVDTTVSLRDGQSFAIAGLLDVSNIRNVEQVPWIGQIPIIGALFRSAGFLKRETELVIIVTPKLVRPGAPDEPLRSPLDATRSSNDAELFLLGMMEVDRDLITAFKNGAGVAGPYGHMIDLEFEDGTLQK